MRERVSIFSAPALDVSDFRPKTPASSGPQSAEIDEVTNPKFRSREPSETAELPRPAKRKPMTYRTGRNVVFSVKTTQAVVDRFYDVAERNGWKANETFEKALESLLRQMGE